MTTLVPAEITEEAETWRARAYACCLLSLVLLAFAIVGVGRQVRANATGIGLLLLGAASGFSVSRWRMANAAVHPRILLREREISFESENERLRGEIDSLHSPALGE